MSSQHPKDETPPGTPRSTEEQNQGEYLARTMIIIDDKMPKSKIQTSFARSSKLICAICRGGISSGNTVRITPCNHVFHSDCLEEWLIHKASKDPPEKANCPICNRDLGIPIPERKHEPEPPAREWNLLGILQSLNPLNYWN